MAFCKACPSLFPLLCIIMVMTTQLAMGAGRGTPTSHKEVEKKQPEWFYDSHDGSFLIPGIGRVMVPPVGGFPGSGGDDSFGNSGGGTGNGYIPGGDDTFVPNPGFEVPNPVGDVPQP